MQRADDPTVQLVEPINQTAEVDSLVPGLCAFLLGLCYEFNREPGEITRQVPHTLASRGRHAHRAHH